MVKGEKSNIENGTDHFCEDGHWTECTISPYKYVSRDPILTVWNSTVRYYY